MGDVGLKTAREHPEQVVHVENKPPLWITAKERAVRIGALSWSQTFTDQAQWLTDKDLVRTLDKVRAERGDEGLHADIILCSGAKFWSDRSAAFETIASEIETAAQCAVVMEWPDAKGRNRWVLIDKGKFSLLRRDQYVVGVDDVPAAGHLVIAELSSGLGVIQVWSPDEHIADLVVLICGEARVLEPDGEKSVFKGCRLDGIVVPEVFKEQYGWVMLHPSHRPYAGHSHRDGYNFVGSWEMKGQVNDPVFSELVRRASSGYEDGTFAPRVVVHAGPFQPGDGVDEDVAVVSFHASRGGRVVTRPGPRTRVPGLVEALYAEFDV